MREAFNCTRWFFFYQIWSVQSKHFKMFLFISLLPLTTKLDKGPDKLYLFENGRQNIESIRNA